MDRYNGYRYYSLEQLPRLNRILALKELGFSLDQIGAQLDRALTVDELRSILRQKRVELEDRLHAEQARLALLETHIEQIDRSGSQPEVEPLFPSQSSQSSKKIQKESRMEIKLMEKPAFMVVGMKYLGKNENQEIAQMWGRFNQVAGAIARDVKGCYGVCSMLEGVDDGTFEYLACFELDKIDQLPDWAVVKMLPANTYAIFEHVGAANGLRDTYHKIYTTWLPQSGYEPKGGYDMEVYTDEFKDFAPDSKMYIYVPVKKK